MSGRAWDTLHPVTQHDIEIQGCDPGEVVPEAFGGVRHCGCEKRGDRWWLCSYHVGFDEGAWAQEVRNGVKQ